MSKNSHIHEQRMAERRKRQLARRPDFDARLIYFSKNSLPEYRNPELKKEQPVAH